MIDHKELYTIQKLENVMLLKKSIKYLEDRISIIDEQLIRCKTSNYSDDKGDYNADLKEELMDKKNEYINILTKNTIELKSIEDAIDLLEGIEREVITDFYMNNYSVFEIAKNKSYSESYIRKVKQSGINNITKILFGICG